MPGGVFLWTQCIICPASVVAVAPFQDGRTAECLRRSDVSVGCSGSVESLQPDLPEDCRPEVPVIPPP